MSGGVGREGHFASFCRCRKTATHSTFIIHADSAKLEPGPTFGKVRHTCAQDKSNASACDPIFAPNTDELANGTVWAVTWVITNLGQGHRWEMYTYLKVCLSRLWALFIYGSPDALLAGFTAALFVTAGEFNVRAAGLV